MEETQSSLKSSLIDFFQTVIIAIVLCVVIYVFFATPNQIDGQSMEPTFTQGELVITSKIHEWLGNTQIGNNLGFNYSRGDIVVFQKPGFNDFIKRVIGIPGDNVQIKEGKVYINNQELVESYLPQNTQTEGVSFIKDGDDVKILGKDEYFLLGDNRSKSHDSRYLDIGFIKREWIKGKVLLRYWPISKFWVVQHANL